MVRRLRETEEFEMNGTHMRRVALGVVATGAVVAISVLVLAKRTPRPSIPSSVEVQRDPASPLATGPADPGELCDGRDDDGDHVVDEGCDCVDRFVEPANRNLSLWRLTRLDTHRVLAQGANDSFEVSPSGVVRVDHRPAFVLFDADGAAVTLRNGRAYATRQGVEVELGRTPIRRAPTGAYTDLRFDRALALVGGRVVPTSAAVTLPRLPSQLTAVAGDASAFVAGARDGTVQHVANGAVVTSRLPVREAVKIVRMRRPDDGFAATDHGVYRFDGTTWSEVIRVAADRVSALALAATSVYVASTKSSGVSRLHVASSSGVEVFELEGRAHLADLVATDDAMYAIDDGTLVRWTGSAFELVIDRMPFEFEAIAGTSATDVVAVGDHVVMHYDGRTWRAIHREPYVEQWYQAEFSDVFARGPNDFLVLGRSSGRTIVRSCSRDGCRPIEVPESDSSFFSIAADGDDLLLGGLSLRVIHRDGTVSDSAVETSILDILPRGPHDVVLVGGDYTVDPARGAVWHYDGSSISKTSGAAQQLEQVALGPTGQLLAVGGNAAVYASEGTLFLEEVNGRFVRRSPGGSQGLTGVASLAEGLLLLAETHVDSDAGDSWGDASFVLRLSSENRPRDVARGTFTATALFATSLNNVFIVGRDGALLHRCGATPVGAAPTVETVNHRGNGFPR